MNELKQALRQAANKITAARMSNHPVAKCVLLDEASEIIDAALAQPEPEPAAWMHEDGRVVPAATMATARRDGGATLSSLRGYAVPLYASAPTQSAELAAVTAERDLLIAELRRLHGEFSRTERRNIELSDEAGRLQSALDDARAGESVARMAAQRQPLTDAQIDGAISRAKRVATDHAGWVVLQRREFARAIERAHGISAAATTTTAPSEPADQR